MRQLVAVILVVVLTSCSGSSSDLSPSSVVPLQSVTTATASPTVPTTPLAPESPVITLLGQPFLTTWQPADDYGQMKDSATAELDSIDGSVLVPTALPEGTKSSSGRLFSWVAVPTGGVHADVFIDFQNSDGAQSLSLSSSARPETPACEGRLAGQGGLDTWEVAQIRAAPGCIATNEVGLTFIEWEEGLNRYHVETRMEQKDALSWLESWIEIP